MACDICMSIPQHGTACSPICTVIRELQAKVAEIEERCYIGTFPPCGVPVSLRVKTGDGYSTRLGMAHRTFYGPNLVYRDASGVPIEDVIGWAPATQRERDEWS